MYSIQAKMVAKQLSVMLQSIVMVGIIE
jgi:hypothetical protein